MSLQKQQICIKMDRKMKVPLDMGLCSHVISSRVFYNFYDIISHTRVWNYAREDQNFTLFDPVPPVSATMLALMRPSESLKGWMDSIVDLR